MAIDFPSSPTVGQQYAFGGVTYTFTAQSVWAVTSVVDYGGFTTGDVKATIKIVADSGWIMMNDGTIGDATSGATTRANADTQMLFVLMWNNTNNSELPVLPGGRGANGAADFAAHKTIIIPKMLGRALAGAGSGASLTGRSLAQAVGVESVALALGELPGHTHTVSADLTHAHSFPNYVIVDQGNWTVDPGAAQNVAVRSSTINTTTNTGLGLNISTGASGSGVAHANMQPTTFLNFMIKL